MEESNLAPMKCNLGVVSAAAVFALTALQLSGGVPDTGLASPIERHSLATGLLNTAVYGLVGVVLAIIGYKLFDLCTPGNLHKEILENRNVAAAVVAAAVILGVSLIVVASIVG